MSKPSHNPAQLNLLDLDDLKQAVSDVVKKNFTDQKTAANPSSPLSSYPQKMRIDQVASYLNCSDTHVENLIDEGKLAATNIATTKNRKCIRVNRDAVAQYEKDNAA